MPAVVNEAMHKDHLAWRSDNNFWCNELRHWQYDFYKAKGDLARLETLIDDHERALANHAAAIRFYEEQLQSHEHAMASGAAGAKDEMTVVYHHDQEAVRHRDQLAHHRRIKAHHYNVMKHWRSLLKAFEEPL
jgi:hypothetical protein